MQICLRSNAAALADKNTKKWGRGGIRATTFSFHSTALMEPSNDTRVMNNMLTKFNGLEKRFKLKTLVLKRFDE
jgi:hypothetical protein